MHIVVIGGGIVGLTSAYKLAKQGVDVTVIEKNNNCEQETSAATACMIQYSFFKPFGFPGAWHYYPKMMLTESKGTHIHKKFDPDLWRFLFKIMFCEASKEKLKKNVANLERYSRLSLAEMEDIRNQKEWDFDCDDPGILYFFSTPENFENSKAYYDELINMDYQFMSPEECLKLEPALKHWKGGDTTGGIYAPGDKSGDSRMFCSALFKELESMENVTLLTGYTVEDFELENGKINCVKTNKQDIKADAFIMCGGYYSKGLLNKIGVKTDLYPVKGYTLVMPNSIDLKVPLYADATNRFVLTPLGNDRVRCAGLADFEGVDFKPNQKRLDYLKKKLNSRVPDLDTDNAEELFGMRPYVPSSGPIVQKEKYDNLYINIGHSMLGWTLSLGTAKHLADLVKKDFG